MPESVSTPKSMSTPMFMSRPRPRPCPLHKSVLIFRFSLFQNGFETSKQTEKIIFLVSQKRLKQNRNRSSFGLFRFEPKQRIVCFEDNLILPLGGGQWEESYCTVHIVMADKHVRLYYCALSLWRVARGSKLMRLELIHGLFIT
jgi:hypothetical protein